MPVKVVVSAEDSPLGEWLASLVVVLACSAFALLLYRGPPPAMDSARIEARSVAPGPSATPPVARTASPRAPAPER
jgi:hypothetical protein